MEEEWRGREVGGGGGALAQLCLTHQHVQCGRMKTCSTLELIEIVSQLAAGTQCLLVGCFTSQQHASVISGTDLLHVLATC